MIWLRMIPEKQAEERIGGKAYFEKMALHHTFAKTEYRLGK